MTTVKGSFDNLIAKDATVEVDATNMLVLSNHGQKPGHFALKIHDTSVNDFVGYKARADVPAPPGTFNRHEYCNNVSLEFYDLGLLLTRNGDANYYSKKDGLDLSGDSSIIGKSVVITGRTSFDRVACGQILEVPC